MIKNANVNIFRLTNKLSEVKNLVKLLQRLKLVDDSKKDEESKQDDIELDDTAMEFDLETHLVENYDEYYDDYAQTTPGNFV